MVKNVLLFLALFLAIPARAELIDISYSGSVTSFANPSSAGDITAGDPISVYLRYNTNDLVDVSHAASLPRFGADSLPGLQVATLSGPSNILTFTIGNHRFSAADDFDFGDNAGLDGFPAFPLVVFLNGNLLGIETIGIFNDVLDFNLLAIERILLPDLITDDVIGADAVTGEFAFVGTLNTADALIAPVPEPSSLALLLIGISSAIVWRTGRKSGSGTN